MRDRGWEVCASLTGYWKILVYDAFCGALSLPFWAFLEEKGRAGLGGIGGIGAQYNVWFGYPYLEVSVLMTVLGRN